jgi:hypothetical protein
MRYYYRHQTDSFLEGDMEYLGRFHMDYPPGDTKEEALDRAKEYFMGQLDYYLVIAGRMGRTLEVIKMRNSDDRD